MLDQLDASCTPALLSTSMVNKHGVLHYRVTLRLTYYPPPQRSPKACLEPNRFELLQMQSPVQQVLDVVYRNVELVYVIDEDDNDKVIIASIS